MPDTTPKRDHAVNSETPAETMDEKIGELPPKPVADSDAEPVVGGAVDAYIYFGKKPSSDFSLVRNPG